MLHKETERNFIVHPSWAEAQAKWDELAQLIADPLNSRSFRPGWDYRRFGWADPTQQRYELTNGPEGGGIIAWYDPPPRRGWLPSLIFTREANVLAPNGMDSYYDSCDKSALGCPDRGQAKCASSMKSKELTAGYRVTSREGRNRP
jgi:hypothetical protein